MQDFDDVKDIFMSSDYFFGLQQRLTNYRKVLRGEKGLIGSLEDYDKLMKWATEVTSDMQERRWLEPKQPSKIRSKIGREAKALFVHQCLVEAADIVCADFMKQYKTLPKDSEAASDLAWGAVHRIRAIMEIAAGSESIGEYKGIKVKPEKPDFVDIDDCLDDAEERLSAPKQSSFFGDENSFRTGGVVDGGKTILGYVSHRSIIDNVGGPISYAPNFPAAESHALAAMMQVIAKIHDPKDFLLGLVAGHVFGKGCTQSETAACLVARWWQAHPNTSEGISDELNNIISAIDLIKSQRVATSVNENLGAEISRNAQGKKAKEKDAPHFTNVVSLLHPDTVATHETMLQSAFRVAAVKTSVSVKPAVSKTVTAAPPKPAAILPQAIPASAPASSPRNRAKPIVRPAETAGASVVINPAGMRQNHPVVDYHVYPTGQDNNGITQPVSEPQKPLSRAADIVRILAHKSRERELVNA